MKKFVVTLLITALLILVPTIAKSGTFLRYGLGVFNSSEYGTGESKTFSLGYEEEWFGPLIRQYEIGLFTDSGGGGRKGSGYGNYSIGIEVNPGYFVMRSLWGIGVITTSDSMLGGWFEFNQDLFIGVRDDRNRMIGFDYKHISSGGIYTPNMGRDFIVVHVEIPW